MAQTSPILELQRQRMLLEIEYFTEKEAYRRQTETMGLQRIIKRGDAWFPLRVGKSYYNSLNQLAIEVHRQSASEDDTDIEHNFEFGKPVVFFTANNQQPSTNTQRSAPNIHLSYFNFTGTVSFVDGDRMVVTVPDSAPLLELQNSERQVGVALFFDETSYKTMFDALDRVMKAKSGRLAYLRDLFYSTKAQPQTYSFAPMQFPWLNPTQERAVNEVLRAKDLMVVHGPPGTGKTTTLVEAIYETLHRESQVLVCAQSNMAVDWISEQLVDRGVNVLRIGNPTRVNDKMLSFTYERRFEAHPDYEMLWAIRKAIRDLRSHKKRGSENWHQKMDRLKSRATELEIRINAQLFGEARVIACTLVGSANRLLEGTKFNTLFIDEAAQALEAACWIPIRRVSRVVLAGDHCQLPPTVKSLAALKAGLGRTLMERLVENHPGAVSLLQVQYRMNDDIMRFSSDWFYGGRVQSAPQIRHRSILDYDIPIEWVDTQQLSISSPTGGGRERAFNPFHSAPKNRDYTEGNAWQYTWLVPHDVHGLVSLFGSEKQFVSKLDSLFIVEGDLGEEAPPDISGLIGQYAHGNEPSHHVLYMYNYVGQPWKGAKLIRQTLGELYRNAPDGLSGNEDVGQMSAWYILSAMGIYQVEPAGGKYVFGSPLFPEVTMKVGNGKTFTIKAHDVSNENIYIQNARLNGKPYSRSYIMYDDIVRGGTLEFQMGPQPSSFGTNKKDRP